MSNEWLLEVGGDSQDNLASTCNIIMQVLIVKQLRKMFNIGTPKIREKNKTISQIETREVLEVHETNGCWKRQNQNELHRQVSLTL